MNTYEITITELYKKTVPIRAASVEEAISTASKMWDKNDPLLDAPPFTGVRYVCDKKQG